MITENETAPASPAGAESEVPAEDRSENRLQGTAPGNCVNRLSEFHRTFLNGQAITDAVLDEFGVVSATPETWPEEINDFFKAAGIIFPWPTTDGRIVPQFRPDKPKQEGDKRPLKYVFPKECGGFLSLLRTAEPGCPTLLVEGSRGSVVGPGRLGCDGPARGQQLRQG